MTRASVHDGDVAPELAENRYIDFLVPVERLFGVPEEKAAALRAGGADLADLLEKLAAEP